ncbi:MAG: HD domain-containing protein, partial [Ruminococcus sp.]|nr:HD domain-containing protein [Ruminococcus sp.]
MIYTEMTNKAMRIAYEAHHGQYDVNGVPYIFHPYHIAEQMTDEITTCVALLHDVIEDTEVTFEQLEQEFPEEVITALRLLTHN